MEDFDGGDFHGLSAARTIGRGGVDEQGGGSGEKNVGEGLTTMHAVIVSRQRIRPGVPAHYEASF